MRTIGYDRLGRATTFGRHWHGANGRLLRVRYALGWLVERVIGYDPKVQPWLCRYLGLSGYRHLGKETTDGTS